MAPEQYGFYFDADRCVMCHACELACKGTRQVELGVQWRKVIQIWLGYFPNVSTAFLSVACMHCALPPCREACPTRAISKRGEDGIVVVDKKKCTGCQLCYSACPYGVPQFGADGTMQKCDLCLGLGTKPACTEHCPGDALFVGTEEELAALAAKKLGGRLVGDACPSFFISGAKSIDIPDSSVVIGHNSIQTPSNGTISGTASDRTNLE